MTLRPEYLARPVVVTGGSGFIGTHLVSALLDAGAIVVNLDTKAPLLTPHRNHWVPTDLMDRDSVADRLKQSNPSLIYNLAAHASLAGGADAMRVNVEGIRHLISARSSLESPAHLVHASTQLVAGPASGTFDPLNYEPYGVYGQSKADSEILMRSMLADTKWTIVRPSNIWGPYHPTFANEIWRFIGKRWYLHPEGFDVVRSYGYVGNVVHQLLQIGSVDPALIEGETLYVGDAPVMSTVWLDGFSNALTGKPVRRVPGWLLRTAAYSGELSGRVGGPSPINLGRLARMTTDFPVPIERTFQLLGPSPIAFSEAVQRTVSWLRQPTA